MDAFVNKFRFEKLILWNKKDVLNSQRLEIRNWKLVIKNIEVKRRAKISIK